MPLLCRMSASEASIPSICSVRWSKTAFSDGDVMVAREGPDVFNFYGLCSVYVRVGFVCMGCVVELRKKKLCLRSVQESVLPGTLTVGIGYWND